MKKALYANIILFLTPLIFLGLLNQFNDKPTISELENRALKKKPQLTAEKLFAGDYFKEFEEYFADTFILRDNFVRLSRDIKELRGFQGEDQATIVAYGGANFAAGAQGKAGDKNQGAASGNIIVLKDRAMYIHFFNPQALELYAKAINTLEERLGEQVKVYSLIAPTQIEFVDNRKSREVSASEKQSIDYVNNLLHNVTSVDAYGAIEKSWGEYLYFRTDHHWTALGAYRAYAALMKATGDEPVALERYDVEEIKPFLGSMHTATLSKNLEENPDTLQFYVPFTEHQYYVYWRTAPVKSNLLEMANAQNKNKYGIFLGGDVPLGKIVTQVKNGKKILVIKDSYGNAFAPFLIPHYEEIYVVDPRHYKEGAVQLIRDQNIQEVLFINNTDTLVDAGFPELLMKLIER